MWFSMLLDHVKHAEIKFGLNVIVLKAKQKGDSKLRTLHTHTSCAVLSWLRRWVIAPSAWGGGGSVLRCRLDQKGSWMGPDLLDL